MDQAGKIHELGATLRYSRIEFQILTLVIGLRLRIVDETDGSSSHSQVDDAMEDDEVCEAAARLRGPSNEAMAKFEDYCRFSQSNSQTIIKKLHPCSNPICYR